MAFEHPIVAQAVKDDPDALAFLREMGFVLHWLDDLLDKDCPVDDQTNYTGIWLTLVSLPNNVFYRTHEALLRPILTSAILNWRIANALERQDTPPDDDLQIAFIIRSTYVDLAVMSAAIIGGPAWAVECGVDLRRWAHEEGFGQYLTALQAEKQARSGNVLL
jgi:hypothetical protein